MNNTYLIIVYIILKQKISINKINKIIQMVRIVILINMIKIINNNIVSKTYKIKNNNIPNKNKIKIKKVK